MNPTSFRAEGETIRLWPWGGNSLLHSAQKEPCVFEIFLIQDRSELHTFTKSIFIALLTAPHWLNLYELWTNLRASPLFSIIAGISRVDLKSGWNVIKHVAVPQAFIFSLIKPEPFLLLILSLPLTLLLWQPLGFIRAAVRWKSPHLLYNASRSPRNCLLKPRVQLKDHVTDWRCA